MATFNKASFHFDCSNPPLDNTNNPFLCLKFFYSRQFPPRNQSLFMSIPENKLLPNRYLRTASCAQSTTNPYSDLIAFY